MSSGNFHGTRPDLDACPRVDMCPPSNMSSGNFLWTQVYTVANFYKLPRPMLFPTTSMTSVSTNKIKKTYFIFLLQIKSKSMISVSTNKNKKPTLFFLLQIQSKSMISVSTNKNKKPTLFFLLQIQNILYFLYFKSKSSLCFRFPQTKIRICFVFILFFWPGP